MSGASDGCWLITGGCGFIGSRLLARLCGDRSVRLRILDNLSTGTVDAVARHVRPLLRASADDLAWPDAPGLAEVVRADIVDADAVMRAAQGATTIVHLAANTGVTPSVENPRADCLANVIGTLNALEAARQAGVGRFIFASSGAPVGEVEPPIHEELAPHPVSPYGASKLAGEGYCSAYARTFGVATVALRFGNVYGPGSTHKSSVVAKFIRDAGSAGVLSVFGDGGQTRDFIFVDDLVDAIVRAASTEGIAGEIFQIATDRETSVNELAEVVCARLTAFGIRQPRIEYLRARLGDVRRNFSDTSKAQRRLGWRASTTLADGIDATIRWFVEAGALSVGGRAGEGR
jgi:UDP-glucose 4-epimerase